MNISKKLNFLVAAWLEHYPRFKFYDITVRFVSKHTLENIAT
jgi:hypothetical protein